MDVGQYPNGIRQTIRDKRKNSERGLITVLGGIRNPRQSTLRGCTTHYRLLTNDSNSVVSLESVAKNSVIMHSIRIQRYQNNNNDLSRNLSFQDEL
mgnify:CR=1 FL=1